MSRKPIIFTVFQKTMIYISKVEGIVELGNFLNLLSFSRLEGVRKRIENLMTPNVLLPMKLISGRSINR